MIKRIIEDKINFFYRYNWLSKIALSLLCISGSFLIFFFRNPDAFINPVFYAEDGSVYISSLLTDGFWQSLSNARTDYVVLGNLLLAQLSILVNNLFYGGNIILLPQIIGVVSYLFFSIVANLPLILFRERISFNYLIFMTFIFSFFPIGQSDFEVIGRLTNVGFAFVYISFLFVSYRLFVLKTICNKKIHIVLYLIVDLIIIISALTNPVVYLIFPTIYLPYLKKIFIDKLPFNRIIASLNFSFLSSVFVGIILTYQLLSRFALNRLSGASGLDSPFVFSHAIEMIIARSILYPIIYSIYSHMNDLIVIVLFIILLFVFNKFGSKRNYGLYSLGCYCLFSFSLAAAAFRPGLSSILNNYSTTFPDRYYYGQNLISTFLILVLFYDVYKQVKNYRKRIALFCILLIMFFAGFEQTSTYGNPILTFREIGNFEQNLLFALKNAKSISLKEVVIDKSLSSKANQISRNDQSIEITIYPIQIQNLKIKIPLQIVEKSAAQSKLKNIVDSQCKNS